MTQQNLMHMHTIEDVLLLTDGLDHPECVATHPDGSIWAGGEAGQVYRIIADGSAVELIAQTGGFTMGIAFSPDASWLAICDLKQHCIWKLVLETKELILFADKVNGASINIPNYPVFDEQGNLYVSESGAFRTVTGKIYRFNAAGNGMVWHEGPFSFANGMALSPGGKELYVACTWLPGVEKITIAPDGSAGEREVFVTLPQTCPDGLAFDATGNLYISCYAPNRIYTVTPDKHISILLDDWESHTICNPTNIAFGGHQFSELFITSLGRWHISKIDLGIEGLKLPCFTPSTNHSIQ